MRRRSIILMVLFALIATFVGFTRPLAVYAACKSYSGTYASNATPLNPDPTFAYSVGDVITATNTAVGAPVTGAGADITANGTTTVKFSAGGSVSNSVVATTSGLGSVFFYNNNTPGATMHWSITVGTNCGSGQVTVLTFTDGRVNSHDGQQTAAVYCEADGSVTVWIIIDSKGYWAFTASKAEIARVPAKPPRNTLIKSGLGIRLYRLTTGEFQINSANDYVFIWSGCPAA